MHKLTAPAHARTFEKVPVPGPLLAAWLLGAVWPQRLVSGAAVSAAGPRWFAAGASPPPPGGRALLHWVGKLVV
ncbi:hypothetical protein BEN49_15360 [Hymenobacter coccineus]|uniref:Uncharacterized protein n=1 Tax=Hymenobacter coccineus TaxID=1908235 RepID=A0A1G1SSJ9_9BACT|nr:hypothetical protein BEN49_15360 [Hymenobacter coccineus]